MRPDHSWLETAEQHERDAATHELLAKQHRESAETYHELARGWREENVSSAPSVGQEGEKDE